MTDRIVSKFGGTSNADASAVQASFELAQDSLVTVTSAPGKLSSSQIDAYDGDFVGDSALFGSKVTDQLLLSHQQYVEGVSNDATTTSIRARYEMIVKGLGLTKQLPDNWVDSIPCRVVDSVRYGKDYASMLGERMQAEIYQAMGFTLLEPSRAANALMPKDPFAWRQWLSAATDPRRKHILPGNIWFDGERLHTFDRGGSDISGALAAFGVEADEYHNMTDTTARSADPRLIPAERLQNLAHIPMRVARELGANGTGLLHPEAIVPLMGTGIDIVLRNTFDPNSTPTRYSDDLGPKDGFGKVLGISLMPVSVLTVEIPGTQEQRGSLASLTARVSDLNINTIDIIGSGADSERILVSVEDGEVAEQALRDATRNGEVSRKELSLVTLAGPHIGRNALAIQNRLTEAGAFGKKGSPHHFFSGDHSLRFTVGQGKGVRFVDSAHASLIEDAS